MGRLHKIVVILLLIAAAFLSGGVHMKDSRAASAFLPKKSDMRVTPAAPASSAPSGNINVEVPSSPMPVKGDIEPVLESTKTASSMNSAAASEEKDFISAINGQTSGSVSFSKENIEIKYDLNTGTADFYRDGRKIINAFYSAVKLPQLITSKDYTTRAVSSTDNGYTIVLSGGQNPVMKQHFALSDDYFIVSVEMDGSGLSTNWMAPVVMDSMGGVDTGSKNDVTALWIPFDNDKNATYDASTINKEDTSYEAAAFYDNTSRNGLVVGSITHDTWKTGVTYKGSNNKLDLLEIYGGASIYNDMHDGTMMRDVQAHGNVAGDSIFSPEIFVGFFDDWRNGMETYADANSAVVPKLQWDGGVPFGWNSWGAVGSNLNTQNALAASNFINNSLMPRGFENNNTAYINLDSYWDNSSMNLKKFVDTVHQNGQKAGIYWAPFVDWAKDSNRTVEGSNYKYKDIWLMDDKGNPIDIDGAYALDPTHPGTLQRITYFIGLFKDKGFDEYIKLDFLSHGSLEGRHYDPKVTTGMQAFNLGMQFVDDAIYSIMGSGTFISEAISPLFPYQYADARRISCDRFGYLYESRSLLNSIAYGWWMNGRMYAFNDPDHMVLYNIWWKSNVKVTENEAKTRVTSAAVAGTVFLSGDDFSDPKAQARALKYLTNTNINRIAGMGKSFRPVEGNTGTDAPDLFVLDNGDDGYYIAIFNFDGEKSVTKTIDLKRAGLDPEKKYSAVEQWSNAVSQVSGKLTINLSPAEAKIFLLK